MKSAMIPTVIRATDYPVACHSKRVGESTDVPARWSGRPSPSRVTVPPAVASLAAGRTMVPVWLNEVGGLTYEVGDGAERCFVKWAPAGSELDLDLTAEADRMEWACRFHPVPRPLARGQDADGSWLVTAPVAGDSAVTARWKAEPAAAVTAIGEGLRAMHDALPVAACPFSWSAEERVAAARRKAEAGRQDPSAWHPSYQGLTVAAALESATAIPPADKLVVCHGDACAPNTLIGADGRWSGHVDLGRLGIGDRWADLAIATWSTGWNYGPGWDGLLLDAYGVEPDPERTAFYRLLWELG
jgi:kanamycin kinase